MELQISEKSYVVLNEVGEKLISENMIKNICKEQKSVQTTDGIECNLDCGTDTTIPVIDTSNITRHEVENDDTMCQTVVDISKGKLATTTAENYSINSDLDEELNNFLEEEQGVILKIKALENATLNLVTDKQPLKPTFGLLGYENMKNIFELQKSVKSTDSTECNLDHSTDATIPVIDISNITRHKEVKSDSTTYPVVDISKGTPVTATSENYSTNADLDEELDGFLEEQAVILKIKALENARLNLVTDRTSLKPPYISSSKNEFHEEHNKPEMTVDESICDDNSFFDSLIGDNEFRDDVLMTDKKDQLGLILNALKHNIMMHSTLNNVLSFLILKYDENKQQQIIVNSEIDNLTSRRSTLFSKNSRKKSWYSKFGMPYFKDKDRFACPGNQDYKKMQSENQLITVNLPTSRLWRIKEKAILENAVKNCLIEENVSTMYEEMGKLNDKLKTGCMVKTKALIQKDLKHVQEQINKVKKKTLKNLFSIYHPDREFDWLKVANTELLGHSAEECQRMWHLYVKPTVNKKTWTIAEDKKLVSLAEQYHFQDWDFIAKCHGKNRSGYQCFINFQTRLNKEIKTVGKWTKEEDNKLVELVRKCRIGNYIPWNKVAYFFDGRTVSQLHCRWNGSLNPDFKKGRFTKKEDRLLMLLVKKFGQNFSKLSKIMRDRNAVQLRERYERAVLNKYQNSGRWNLSEDEELMSLVQKHGVKNWSNISKHLVTRTREQIRHRYNAIKKFFLKNPNASIHDINRLPAIESSNKTVASLKVKRLNAGKKEGKKLMDLIEDSDVDDNITRYHNSILLNRIRKGRKKIMFRNKRDKALVYFFKQLFVKRETKLKIDYEFPDISKSSRVIVLFSYLLKTRLYFEESEYKNSLIKLPLTLQNVVKKVIDESKKSKLENVKFIACNHGVESTSHSLNSHENEIQSVKENELQCYSSKNEKRIISGSALNGIDCLPVDDPNNLKVGFDYYWLCEESTPLIDHRFEENKRQTCEQNSHQYNPDTRMRKTPSNVIYKSNHKDPFTIHWKLPPNIVSVITSRAMIYLKHNLFPEYHLKHHYYHNNIFCCIDFLKVCDKKFQGYFFDEIDKNSNENDTVSLDETPIRNFQDVESLKEPHDENSDFCERIRSFVPSNGYTRKEITEKLLDSCDTLQSNINCRKDEVEDKNLMQLKSDECNKNFSKEASALCNKDCNSTEMLRVDGDKFEMSGHISTDIVTNENLYDEYIFHKARDVKTSGDSNYFLGECDDPHTTTEKIKCKTYKRCVGNRSKMVKSGINENIKVNNRTKFTKDEAVHLFKERLKCVFSWSVILSTQPHKLIPDDVYDIKTLTNEQKAENFFKKEPATKSQETSHDVLQSSFNITDEKLAVNMHKRKKRKRPRLSDEAVLLSKRYTKDTLSNSENKPFVTAVPNPEISRSKASNTAKQKRLRKEKGIEPIRRSAREKNKKS